MARNKMEDLRNHLFAQLEKLGDDEDMKNPIKRERNLEVSKAMVSISGAIVETAKTEMQYLKTLDEIGANNLDVSFIKEVDNTPKIDKPE